MGKAECPFKTDNYNDLFWKFPFLKNLLHYVNGKNDPFVQYDPKILWEGNFVF